TAISFPTGGHGPDIGFENGRPSFPTTDPVDDLPPVTVITGARAHDGTLSVRGMSADNGRVKEIRVGERTIPIGRSGCSEWSIDLPNDAVVGGKLSAHAVDEAGNVEPRPHVVSVAAEVTLLQDREAAGSK